jgi:hypothetical protein
MTIVSPADLGWGIPKCVYSLETIVPLRKLVAAAKTPSGFLDAAAYREKNKIEISTKRGIKTGIANLQV